MIRSITVFLVFGAVLGQEYDFTNNLVDFEQSPYQSISLPYPYQDNRDRQLINIQSKPIKNAIVLNNGLEEIKRPANVIEPEAFRTSVSNIHTSLLAKMSAVAFKLLGSLKIALKLLVVNIPAVILGAVVVVGVCKITSLCTKISSIQSLAEAQKELTSLITPERLDTASEFLQEAIRRYRSIQAN